MMRYCPKCGSQLKDDERYCFNCGQKIQPAPPMPPQGMQGMDTEFGQDRFGEQPMNRNMPRDSGMAHEFDEKRQDFPESQNDNKDMRPKDMIPQGRMQDERAFQQGNKEFADERFGRDERMNMPPQERQEMPMQGRQPMPMNGQAPPYPEQMPVPPQGYPQQMYGPQMQQMPMNGMMQQAPQKKGGGFLSRFGRFVELLIYIVFIGGALIALYMLNNFANSVNWGF